MTSLAAKNEMTIRYLEENSTEQPLYMQGLPDIIPGDWLMIQLPNWGTCFYGEVLNVIQDPEFPEDIAETYEIFVPDENRIMKFSPLEIMSHYSPKDHKELMKGIKDIQIAKDMEYITNLVISKKANKTISWT
jgi:hypothetical protein